MKVDYTQFSRAELIRTIEVLAQRERDLLNALARAGVMPWDSDVQKRPKRQVIRAKTLSGKPYRRVVS